MLWRLTLAVAALCVGSMCHCVKADLMSRLSMPRDYGVKLCGREFIRAVIFTCGGSRWRRSTDGDSDSFPLEDDLPAWLTESRSTLPQVVPSSSLADLLALYGAAGYRQLQPLGDPAPPQRSRPSSAVLGEQQDGVPSAVAWSVPSKRKRNFSLGVAGMCCNQGCTKNDIGRLC